MTRANELEVQEKKELATPAEKTAPGKFYVPATDIYETPDALSLTMEMPGVDRRNVDVTVENGVLRVEGRIDFAKYEGFDPLYTEYNVGHYVRTFDLPDKIDQDGIRADLDNGVLTLTLRKAKAAAPRRIAIG